MENLIEVKVLAGGNDGKVEFISHINTLFFFKKLHANGELNLFSTAELITRAVIMLEKSANVTLLEHFLISDYPNFRKYTFMRNDNFTNIHDFIRAVETMMVEYDL